MVRASRPRRASVCKALLRDTGSFWEPGAYPRSVTSGINASGDASRLFMITDAGRCPDCTFRYAVCMPGPRLTGFRWTDAAGISVVLYVMTTELSIITYPFEGPGKVSASEATVFDAVRNENCSALAADFMVYGMVPETGRRSYAWRNMPRVCTRAAVSSGAEVFQPPAGAIASEANELRNSDAMELPAGTVTYRVWVPLLRMNVPMSWYPHVPDEVDAALVLPSAKNNGLPVT